MISIKNPLQISAPFFLSLLLSSPAANVTWLGGAGDWDTGSNWDNGIGPEEGDRAFFNNGDVVAFDFENPENLRAIVQNGGTLNILGGILDAGELASATTFFDGTVNHSGGDTGINRIQMGTANGRNGQLIVSGGDFTIGRSLNNFSLYLGGLSATGSGSLTISGGSFMTRDGIKLGDANNAGLGHVTIIGSNASEISLGTTSTNIDGNWEQHANSTLSVRADAGGITPIFIKDNGNEGAWVTFENGALLDPGFLNNSTPPVGGTWTVMEVENADIVDNGLTLASSVDASVWSFAIDNSGANGILTVTAVEPASFSRDVVWDGSENTLWQTPLNWNNNYGPFQNSNAIINSGTINYTTASEQGINLRSLRMSSGTLNLSSGLLQATALASGHSDLDGIINQTGGTFIVNAAEIGGEIGNDSVYHLSEGELRIARARSGTSLYLGADRTNSNSGNGTLIISGGQFTTRTGVELGDVNASGTGRFVVLGTDPSEIGIGGANDDNDAFWLQNSGSTLEVGIDSGGVTPIVIVDSDSNTNGTSATFANGSLLDVDYHNITQGGGSWVVMEVENGPIIDQGLAFASGVDTSTWSFSIDNSGNNGRLLVSATGPPLGNPIVIGNTLQQQMRYGMDYERLWYWTGGLNNSERDDIARWSAVDTDIDFIRVAINSKYELIEGTYDLSAYTSKIIPMMQEMQQANPDIKFFASPRPLNEAVSGVAWQPYPQWVTGSTGNNSNFDFDWQKCAEYLERYILLMKSYGFKISFLDLTNEWQTASFSGTRLTTGDMRDIAGYLNTNLDPADMPLIVAPSAWNYSEGGSWIDEVNTTARRNAIDIAACHNTNRTGNAATFAQKVENQLGSDTEIWNTEVHGWKSTSSENETTSFFYYLEAVRAGFGGLNGWLAIGTTNQGHSYILNPSGTPTRNVKYYIFRKFSSTSNRGHALNIIDEPESLLLDASNEYDPGNPRNVAAFIKGNLMTVWVINENPTPVPVNIMPSGYTVATPTVRRTHWIDPSDVEGFETTLPVYGGNSVASTIPGESVCCFEITLGTEDFATRRIEAEDYSHQWGTVAETSGDVDGDQNLGFISNGDWTRYGEVALLENSSVSFRVARANGRPDGFIRVREGNSEGAILGEVDVPTTGNWQGYVTIETELTNDPGIYNLYLEFVEDGTSNNAFVNFNWFSVNEAVATPITGLAATTFSSSQINLTWDANADADSYTLKRSTSSSGPFTTIASNLTGTSYSNTGLSSGQAYYYLISGFAGSTEGPESAAVSATTLTAAPSNLQAIGLNDFIIHLSWSASSGATSYRLMRSTTMGGPYTQIAITTNTSHNDVGVTPGTRYYYVVHAVNSVGDSTPSAEANFRTFQPIVPANLCIDSLDITSNGTASETLSFTMAQTGLGQFYQVEGTVDLENPNWQPTSAIEPGTGGLLNLDFPIDTNADPMRFFRVKVWTE